MQEIPEGLRGRMEAGRARQEAVSPQLTVRVDGNTYTVPVGLHAYIRAQRDHAQGFKRGGNAPGHVRVLTRLREHVAQTLGTDRRTAALILRSIQHT